MAGRDNEIINVDDYVSILESGGLSINENRYEGIYAKIRDLYGYGNSVTEDSLLIKAMKDAYPNEKINASTIQDIINNYEMISAYKERVDDILGKNRELTAALLYESYKEIIKENNSHNISSLNWYKSINPNTIMAKYPVYPPDINSENEYFRYAKDRAEENLKRGQLNFERDIVLGKIKLPMQYSAELDEVKDNFLKENFEDIILDIIEDGTVSEVHLSKQARTLKNFSNNIKQYYSKFSKEARRTAVYKAYKDMEDNRIPVEDKDFVEQYINRQLFPRELKLEKVLSLHTVNKDTPREVVYTKENMSLIKEFIPAKNLNEKDKMLINISLGRFEKTLGDFSIDEEKAGILRDTQNNFGDIKDFWKEIDNRYNNYFQFQVKPQNTKDNIPKNERTFKNSRNELLDALSDGRFIAISDYSSEYFNNHDFKLITVNNLKETVCLEVSKRKFCLLEHINNDDWETKFKIETKALDGEKLNDIIKKATRKNTSTRIFTKESLGNIVKAWNLENNKLEMLYKSDLIAGIRSAVNATIGYANKGLNDIITYTPKLPDFVYFKNEKGNIKHFIRFKEDETEYDKFEISIIKRINLDICNVVKAKRIDDKFVFDEEAYKNETDPIKIEAAKSIIKNLNYNLNSPTKHVSIEAHKWIFEEEVSRIIADKIFDFKMSFGFYDIVDIEKALEQAESDSIGKLEALYQNGLLGKFVERDKIFSGKKFPEDTLNYLSDKEKIENSKSNTEQSIEQSLKPIGLNELDLNRLRTEIDIFENGKPISDLINSMLVDMEEFKESGEQVSNEALEDDIFEEDFIPKEKEKKEIVASPEEQRLEIDDFVNKVGNSPDEIYSTLKLYRKDLSQEAGYQYLINNVKEGEKLIGIRKDIMQESLRLRAENADNLQDLDLSKNEAETFLLSETYANISEKTADEKIEILKEINSHIEELDTKADENEHNEDTMRSIYLKALEIELIKDLVQDLDTREEARKELSETLTGSRVTRIKDYINEKETFYSLSEEEKETLEKMKEIVDNISAWI